MPPAAAGTYQRIADELRRRIETGVYPAGSDLPPTKTLAGEFTVSLGTVQRALRLLDAEQLTGSRQGRPRVVLSGAPETGLTRYEQIASSIRTWIGRGELDPGARLPSETELAAGYGVSRATIREAISLLEASGEVVQRAGRRYVAGSSTGASSDLAYERLAQQLGHDITTGRYRPGERLPGETQLAADHGVSRPTVRQALALLRNQGRVRNVPKQGWFIADSGTRSGAR